MCLPVCRRAMKTTFNFTIRKLEAAAPADTGKRYYLWDSATQGLGVIVGAKVKNYLFQGRLGGKTVRMTIGAIGAWTLGDARERARELQRLIDQGLDPRQVIADKTAQQAAKRQKEQVSNIPALEAWQKYTGQRRPHWSERHYRDHLLFVDEGGRPITRGLKKGQEPYTQVGILRPVLSLAIPNITKDVVRQWLDAEVAKRPTTASRAFSFLGTFLRWCAEQPQYSDVVNADACDGLRRSQGRAMATRSKTDALQREQLKPWFDAVQSLPNQVIRTYLQVLLLTGARRNELTGLQWADVDFEWGSMEIKDKATQATRIIPLTPYVKRLLLNLRAYNAKLVPVGQQSKASSAGWVFVSATSASGHIVEPRDAHNRALAVAGLPHVTLHGLRRSFAQLAEWVEAPSGAIAQIQGHQPSAVAEKHYRQRPLDLLRVWHERIEEFILTEAGLQARKEGENNRLKAI